jgi:hypothetical protein
VVQAYPSILQQFKGNLNRKKFFFGVSHSLRFNNPEPLKIGPEEPEGRPNQRIKKKESNPFLHREKMRKGREWFIEEIA